MTDVEWITLTRRRQDIPEMDPDRTTWKRLSVRYRGVPLGVAREFIEDAKAKGWRGTENIPPECIDRGRE